MGRGVLRTVLAAGARAFSMLSTVAFTVPALSASTLGVAACAPADPGPRPSIALSAPRRNEHLLGEFQHALNLTVEIERHALRRPPLHDTVSAQIAAMVEYARRRGHGEIEPRELEYVPRSASTDARMDMLHVESTRLGVAALALFPLLRLDRGPAELADVALRVLRRRLGRDAVVEPIPDDFMARDDPAPSFQRGVGYLALRSLDGKSLDRVLMALAQWSVSQRPPRAVILDLAECIGGAPPIALRIFDQFAPGEPAFGLVFRNEEGGTERRMLHGNFPRRTDYDETPVFVVTSPRTSTIGEALAFALRVRRGARVLGAMTQGTGRLMGWTRLLRPELLGVTVADVLGCDGLPLAGRALIPDACAGPDGLHPLTLRTVERYRAECAGADRGVDEDTIRDYVRASL